MIYSPTTGFPHLIPHEPQVQPEELAQPAPAPSAHAPLPRVPAPNRATRDAIDEWDLLLTALSARLRSTVTDHASSSTAKSRAQRIQRVVLECATDLDLLHVALRAESVQRQKIESRFGQSNDAVARAIAGIGESLAPAKSTTGRPKLGKKASAIYRIFG